MKLNKHRKWLSKWLFMLGALSFLGAMPSFGGEALVAFNEATGRVYARKHVKKVLKKYNDGEPFGKKFLSSFIGEYEGEMFYFVSTLQSLIAYDAIEIDSLKGTREKLGLLEYFILYDKEPLFNGIFKLVPLIADVYGSEFPNDRDDLKKCFTYYSFALLSKMVVQEHQNNFENVLYKIVAQIEDKEGFIFDELLKDLELISPLRRTIQALGKDNYYQKRLLGESGKNTGGIAVISALLKLNVASELYELLEKKKNYQSEIQKLNDSQFKDYFEDMVKALKAEKEAVNAKIKLRIDHYGLPRLQHYLLIKEINEETCERIELCNTLQRVQRLQKERKDQVGRQINETFKLVLEDGVFPDDLTEIITSYEKKSSNLAQKITPQEAFGLLQKVAKVENEPQEKDFEFLASLFIRSRPYALFLKYYDDEKCENGELAAAAFRAFVKKMNDKYAEDDENHKSEYFFRDQMMEIVKRLLEEAHPLLDKKVKLADGKGGSLATFLVDEVFCALDIDQPALPIYLAGLSEKMKANHKPLKIDITKYKYFLPRLFEKNPKNIENVSILWNYKNEGIVRMGTKKIQRQMAYNKVQRKSWHTKIEEAEKKFGETFGIKNLNPSQKFTNQEKDDPFLMARVKRLKNRYKNLMEVLHPTKQLDYKNTKNQKDQEGRNILEIEAYSARPLNHSILDMYKKGAPQIVRSYLDRNKKERLLRICDDPNDDQLSQRERSLKKRVFENWLKNFANQEKVRGSHLNPGTVIIFTLFLTLLCVFPLILLVEWKKQKLEAQKKKNATLRAKKRLKKRKKQLNKNGTTKLEKVTKNIPIASKG